MQQLYGLFRRAYRNLDPNPPPFRSGETVVRCREGAFFLR